MAKIGKLDASWAMIQLSSPGSTSARQGLAAVLRELSRVLRGVWSSGRAEPGAGRVRCSKPALGGLRASLVRCGCEAATSS